MSRAKKPGPFPDGSAVRVKPHIRNAAYRLRWMAGRVGVVVAAAAAVVVDFPDERVRETCPPDRLEPVGP